MIVSYSCFMLLLKSLTETSYNIPADNTLASYPVHSSCYLLKNRLCFSFVLSLAETLANTLPCVFFKKSNGSPRLASFSKSWYAGTDQISKLRFLQNINIHKTNFYYQKLFFNTFNGLRDMTNESFYRK